MSILDGGLRVLRFECDESFEVVLDQLGETPLPPYIKRSAGSTPAGSRALPDGLRQRQRRHCRTNRGTSFYSNPCWTNCADRGIKIAEITLHVGYGTFEPVRVEDIEQHRVAPEVFEISSGAAETINEARAKGGRVVAVGTTTTRALESAVNAAGQVEAGKGVAAVTIIPGYAFRITDALITNFHLPRSSLLLLVCAFADRELVLNGYRHAVRARYRFYSYGDCMLIQ